MKIKNLTSKLKELGVVEMVGGRSYNIYLEPFSETELEGLLPADVNDPEISIESPHRVEKKVEIPQIEEIIVEDSKEAQTEDIEQEIIPEKFICDECGAEYASARGLATHKNKSHK